MRLRPYQARFVAGALGHLLAGRSCLVVSATGTGKTKTALAIMAPFLAMGGKVLVVAPRRALVDQWRREVPAGVTVTTVQGLKAPPAGYALVVVDEAHNFTSATRAALLEGAGAPLLGLTATPRRLDGASLRGLFPHEAGPAYRLTDALREGYLVDCRPYRVHVLDEGKPSVACNSEAHHRQIVERWRELADGRRTIVFVPDIAWADAFAEVARSMGVGAVALHSQSKASVERWRESPDVMAVSVDQFFEGFDAPEISAIVFVRGTQSDRLKIQGIGRGLRPAPGKTDLVLIDVSGVAESIDWWSAYDLDDPATGLRETLTKPGMVADDNRPVVHLPTLFEVSTRLEELRAWAERVASARTLGWVPIETERGGHAMAVAVSEGHRREVVVVAPLRAEPDRCGVWRLGWERDGSPGLVRWPGVYEEPDAFRAAEAAVADLMRTHTRVESAADVRALYGAWVRDRKAPSVALTKALSDAGLEVPATHGAAVKLQRRLYAAGTVATRRADGSGFWGAR